jgi:RNA polymerase sigma-70 factor (ECF subfamily)
MGTVMLGREEQLLQAVAAGDVDAFADLHDALAATVVQVIVRVVRNRHMAEEVAQEVFLAVWQQARSFDPERASARCWLAMLAHRRAVDRVRSEEANRRRLTDQAQRGARDHVIDLDDHTVAHLDLADALDALPPAQRQAIALIYGHGLSHREAAAALDVPLGTAKGRIRAALASLRPHLEAER